ncbi:MAG TPA: penicillin acylase family protein, partial [Microbacterium sp.]|nr:penicillin acylase family protein [Microbacterium sp.]
MSKTAAALSGDAPDAPVRPRLGRRIGLIAYSVFVGVVVLALIAAGVGVWFVNRSFPQTEGTIALDGLSGAVTVQRSELGIPTITASSTDDLFFAQGYVHAQDRFWEMDFRRHVTSGRLAELFGESQLGTDAFLRTLGWREIAEQEVAALDETTLSYYQSYADGVNAYLVDRDKADISLEYAVLGLQNAHYEIEPWTPADSVAWLKAMAWDLRSNIETETERALLATTYTDEQVLELYPPYPFDENPVIVPEITDVPAATETADAATAGIRWTEVADVVSAVSTLIGGTGEGIGSNSWVVAGDYTDTGMPLLANDPHLGASLPSVWYQAGLRCSVVSDTCPFDVSGFSFSGVPGIIIGHNA